MAKKIFLWVLAGCAVLFLAGSALHMLNPYFRWETDMLVSAAKRHEAYGGDANARLPLPPKTARMYRYSDVGVRYKTKTSVSDITAFYQKLAEENSFSQTNEEEKTNLSFLYRGFLFSVRIEDEQNGNRNFFVEFEKGAEKK